MSVSPCRVVSRKPIESKRPSLAVERHVQKIGREKIRQFCARSRIQFANDAKHALQKADLANLATERTLFEHRRTSQLFQQKRGIRASCHLKYNFKNRSVTQVVPMKTILSSRCYSISYQSFLVSPNDIKFINLYIYIFNCSYTIDKD